MKYIIKILASILATLTLTFYIIGHYVVNQEDQACNQVGNANKIVDESTYIETDGSAESRFTIAVKLDNQNSSESILKAKCWYELAAESGLAEAQHNLSLLLFDIEESKRAVLLMREAAMQGLAESENHLGYMYEHGIGVEQNIPLAENWYLKSAAQNNPEAQYNLGLLHFYEKILGSEFEKALYWLNLAAANGSESAQFRLGHIYSTNKDYLDISKAIYWYRLASKQGHKDAAYNLNLIKNIIN